MTTRSAILPKEQKLKSKNYYTLYQNLKKSFTEPNLNKITTRIITLYKSKQYDILKKILKPISEIIQFEYDKEKIGKYFSKLILLYHPDKITSSLNEIEKFYTESDFEKLNSFSHIFSTLKKIDEIGDVSTTIIDNRGNSSDNNETTYSPEQNNYYYDDTNYKNWDEYYYNEKNFDDDYSEEYYTDEDLFSNDDDEIDEKEAKDNSNTSYFNNDNKFSFINILENELIGGNGGNLSNYALEDMDQVELIRKEINDLQGLENCLNLKILNLSGNKIKDISEIWGLARIEELYLDNNKIGYIENLVNLKNLKILDLSNNRIDDISSLFNLDKLEFVNLLNNPVSEVQIRELKESGSVIVLF